MCFTSIYSSEIEHYLYFFSAFFEFVFTFFFFALSRVAEFF